ncbi:10203_t:CDS:2 [Paraglomus occultum]|uniref:10203_t:CDS:1 n=1 Tax=Paraglomus occultum TaxID=144539 RepID=A0A9N9C9F3_9GLOM|nr:10203_t:CDS:2 [Paraglomus occultum]
MEISNDTPISDITDDALASNISVNTSNSNDVHEQIVTQNGESIISNHETQSVISLEIVSASSNSDIQQELEISTSPISAETISLEEKEENEFLDSTYREQVSKEIIQSIREKKLRGQEKIITSQDIKSSLSVKGGQGLIQELFTLEPSLQESQIIQNHVSEISETSTSGESNVDETWQHLAQLCNKAFDAEDKANRANQEEILYWFLYAKDFRLQYNEIIVSSGGKISEKKARSLLYDSVVKQLSIIRKKRSQELGLHLPEISRDALRKKTQRAEKIYILFEKIGHDKIKYIKSYSANSISKLTNDQIQEIINYSCQNVDTDNTEYQFSSENTEISETGGPRKISSEIETSNIITPSSNSENKMIEEVLRSEDATASKSLPETKTKESESVNVFDEDNGNDDEFSDDNNEDDNDNESFCGFSDDDDEAESTSSSPTRHQPKRIAREDSELAGATRNLWLSDSYGLDDLPSSASVSKARDVEALRVNFFGAEDAVIPDAEVTIPEAYVRPDINAEMLSNIRFRVANVDGLTDRKVRTFFKKLHKVVVNSDRKTGTSETYTDTLVDDLLRIAQLNDWPFSVNNHPPCKLYIEDDPYVSSDPEFVINKEDENMEDFAILVVEDKHLKNVGPSTGFGETQIAMEILACVSENIRSLGKRQYTDQTFWVIRVISSYVTFYKAEIPAMYLVELEKGLPQQQSVKVQRWPADNGLRSGFDLAEPEGRRVVLTALAKIRETLSEESEELEESNDEEN